MTHGQAFRCKLQGRPKLDRRAREVAARQRPLAATLIRDGAAQQIGDLLHQRIRRPDLHRAPLSHVSIRAINLPCTSVRRCEQVMNAARATVQHQGGFEMLDRSRVVACCE